MNRNGNPVAAIDHATFEANRRRFPAHLLAAYKGKQVAWSADGTRIVASGDTDAEVDEQLRRQGISVSEVVFSYFDDPELSRLA